jgi:hypothetical protein
MARRKAAILMTEQQDLRRGPPELHDLIGEIDEAIDRGDETVVERLSADLRLLDRNTGAGAST